MTGWINGGVIAWIEGEQYEDETVLVYAKGVAQADLANGLIAQHRPPFARGGDVPPGEWGVIVHHMHDPSRDDFDEIDYHELCPPGAELVVFVPNPCIAKAHRPMAYHYKDGQALSCINYEDADHVGEYWPSELASRITAAGLDCAAADYDEQLTQLICDQLGLPALDRDTLTVDRSLIDSYY
ncbi:hypothetical protein [Streptomyces beihaiensis]|uniref:Uncharacterized protein n=1 Tax=Streptomyces beihaiensis TaxID=2984495 RepID=A0ABT3U2S3_9ACTN|nr:hypothetical protein [Streptomyces beihaiensis]MCX3063622.1 hypothetical protein [Streptomyces beihaiensis]